MIELLQALDPRVVEQPHGQEFDTFLLRAREAGRRMPRLGCNGIVGYYLNLRHHFFIEFVGRTPQRNCDLLVATSWQPKLNFLFVLCFFVGWIPQEPALKLLFRVSDRVLAAVVLKRQLLALVDLAGGKLRLGSKLDGDGLVEGALVEHGELLTQMSAARELAEVEHVRIHFHDDVRTGTLRDLCSIYPLEWLKTSTRFCGLLLHR